MSIERVAVIGSGLMGHGIAQVAAMSGQEVSLIDISDELLAKAVQKIEGSLNRFSEKGKIKESPEDILKRIKTTTSLGDGLSDADYIIEAVSEDPADNKFVVAAAEAEADYIVSGDRHLRDLGSYQGIRILSPDEFLRVLDIGGEE